MDEGSPSEGVMKESMSMVRPNTLVLYHLRMVLNPNMRSSLAPHMSPMTVVMKKTKVEAGATHHSTSIRTRSSREPTRKTSLNVAWT